MRHSLGDRNADADARALRKIVNAKRCTIPLTPRSYPVVLMISCRIGEGDAKRAYGKLYGPKWLSAERDQMPSSINGP